jgi:hypothetical protein
MQENFLTEEANNNEKLSLLGSFLVLAIYCIGILLSGTIFFLLGSLFM